MAMIHPVAVPSRTAARDSYACVSGGIATVAVVGTDKRIRRVLELGQALIDAPRGLSVEQYGKKHGHSRSALYRDLDVLREVGFPIKSEAGRHRVPADFQLFGRRGLQADELLALFVARQIAGRIADSRFVRALASLWA